MVVPSDGSKEKVSDDEIYEGIGDLQQSSDYNTGDDIF